MTKQGERLPEHIRLGENLKRIREEQGYTQETLAKVSGVGKNHISSIETGNRGAGRVVMNKLCDRLMVDEITLRFGSADSLKTDRRQEENQILRMLVGELTSLSETEQLEWIVKIRKWKEEAPRV